MALLQDLKDRLNQSKQAFTKIAQAAYRNPVLNKTAGVSASIQRGLDTTLFKPVPKDAPRSKFEKTSMFDPLGVIPAAAGFVKESLRHSARVGAGTMLDFQNKGPMVPTSKLQKFAFGSEVVKPVSQVFYEASRAGQELTGLPSSVTTPAVFVGGVALEALDFIPGGSSTKNILRELGEEGLQRLAAKYGDDAVEKLLKGKGSKKVVEEALDIIKKKKSAAEQIAKTVKGPMTPEEALKYRKAGEQELIQTLGPETKKETKLPTLNPKPRSLIEKEAQMAEDAKYAEGFSRGPVKSADEVAAEMKERSFISTVREAEITPQSIKDDISGFYKPISVPESYSKAEAFINSSYDEALTAFNTNKLPFDDLMATGEALAAKALKEGREDDALKILQDVAEYATQGGRGINLLKVWGRLTPQGMLRFAQKAIGGKIAGTLEKGKGIIGKHIADVKRTKAAKGAKEASEVLIKENQKAADSVIKDVIEKVKSITNKAKEGVKVAKPKETIPEQELAKRISSAVTKGEPKNEPVKQMVNTLFKVFRELHPEDAKRITDPMDAIRQASQDKKKFQEVWDKSKDALRKILQEKYSDKPEVLESMYENLDTYFGHYLSRPFAEGQGKAVVTKGIKDLEINIADLVKKHFTVVGGEKSKLIASLVEKLGLSRAEAEDLVRFAEKRFDDLTATKKKQLLESMFRSRITGNVDKTLIDKLVEISNLGGFNEDKYFEAIAKKTGIPVLDEDLAKYINEAMQKVQLMEDGVDKDKLVSDVLEAISKKVPPSWSELIDAYRYQNMLSGKGILRNIYGNLFQTMVSRPVQLATEATLDVVHSLVKGTNRTKYYSDVPVYYKNAFNNVINASMAFGEAFRGTLPIQNVDLASMRIKTLPKSLTVVPRFQEAADKFFQTMISAGEYAVQLNRGTDEVAAKKAAEEVAKYSLFRNTLDPLNKEGQGLVLSKIDQFTKALSYFNKIGLGWFIPFIKTSSNIAKMSIEYSPLGFSTVIGAKGGRRSAQLAKAMIGTSIMVGGAKLAAEGKVTTQEVDYDAGQKPWSVNIKGTWVPMAYFGPYGLALAMPAIIEEKLADVDEDSGSIEIASQIATGISGYITDQTALRGLSQFLSMANGDPDYTWAKNLGFTSTQLVPLSGFNRWLGQVLDPVYRQSKTVQSEWALAVPGLSKYLEPYLTEYGDVSERSTINNFLPYDIGYGEPVGETPEFNLESLPKYSPSKPKSK